MERQRMSDTWRIKVTGYMQDGRDSNEDLTFDFRIPAAATVLGSVVSNDTRDMKLTAPLRGLECIYPYLCAATTFPWRDIKHK
jgi:hypothetical protein